MTTPLTRPLTIRNANSHDAAVLADIYNHYILNTLVSFEEISLTSEVMGKRISNVENAGLPWLVAENNHGLIGYAYASPWRSRAAYRHSVEISVYLHHQACGQGLGSALLAALFVELKQLPVHSVIAGIALPNEASVALHEKFGMQKVSHHSEVGYKHSQWLDVAYWQLLLPMTGQVV